MSTTPTLPPDDPKMWRRLLSRVHPDVGGSHELFIWTGAIKAIICDGDLHTGPRPRPQQPPDDKPRVPYPTGTDFEECTRTALKFSSIHWHEPHGRILSLLADCEPLEDLAHEQERGASYKRLAAIGHAWGMAKAERVQWYRVAEDIPLSDRHAGHILSRLKRRAA